MKQKVISIALSVFILYGCGSDNDLRATDGDSETSKSLSGTQIADISGAWRTDCFFNDDESTNDVSVYSTEQHEFIGGSLLINLDHYSDSSCTTYIEQKQYQGSYELGNIVEINNSLFAREIAETFDPMIDGVGSITWNAYFFINDNVLYFGGDRGEHGEEPKLILNKPYRLVE